MIPIHDVGMLIRGHDGPAEVWHDKRLLTITTFPDGHCLLPLKPGTWSLQGADGPLTIDPRLDVEPHGAYELRADGRIHVWPFDGDPDHGFLAGAEPAWSGDRRIDLEDVDLPEGIDILAVQVRSGSRVGPARLLRHRPRPRPVPMEIDQDVAATGPRTNLIFQAPERTLRLTARRDIRQTGQTTTGAFEVRGDENILRFDDLLHGDMLELTVDPPHALADRVGKPVRSRRFRYRAVPEARLEAIDGDEPIDFHGGLTPLGRADALTVLGPVGDLSTPTWAAEWPVATSNGRRTVMEALIDAGVKPEAAKQPAARLWWLRAIEAHQSIRAAARLADLKIRCPPERIDSVARAVQVLDGFPSHVFTELDIPTDVPERIIAFQERLGLDTQRGEDVVALARDTRAALRDGATGWAAAIEAAGLGWVDGALPPVDDAPDLQALAKLIVDDPSRAASTLRDLRARIWRAAHMASADAQRAPDLEARKALFAWHLEATSGHLGRLVAGMQAAGVRCSEPHATDLQTLASAMGEVTRAAEAALPRVHMVPLDGPGFVKRARRDAEETATALGHALGPWCSDRIPAAVRLPARRLLAALDGDGLLRLHVWMTFIQQADALDQDLEGLVGVAGGTGRSAERVRAGFRAARERGDPSIFADVVNDFTALEVGIQRAHDAWDRALAAASPATRKALGLDDVAPPWDVIERRVDLDASEIRNLGRLIVRSPGPLQRRMHDVLADGGALDQACMAVQDAGTEDARADAVAQYDSVRRRIGEWLRDQDVLHGLRVAYVEAIRVAAKEAIETRVGELDAAHVSVLHSFADVQGARELLLIARYLDVAAEMPADAPEAIDDAEGIEQLLDHMQGAAGDAWERIGDAILVRLRAAFPELLRYLGAQAPRWNQVDNIDGAIQWLYAVSRGERDPITGTDMATLLPGTRRLVEHTLKERGLWLI